MDSTIILKAEMRTEKGKKVKELRSRDLIPAVLYGHKISNLDLSVGKKEFEKIYAQTGESTLIQLAVNDQKPRTVLIHDVQRGMLSDDYTHVDFYQVDMSEKIKAKVALIFSGESKAVKDLGGILVKNLNEVEVEALPADLPPSIILDISSLKTFDDAITVSNLNIDKDKVKILANPSEVIVKVNPPRSEEELKALEEKPEEEVATVEGVVKKEEEVSQQASTEEQKEDVKKDESAPKQKT